VMEAPALVSAILLARRTGTQGAGWGAVARDVLAGPSIVLLAGGLLIGALVGPEGAKPLRPVFMDPFKGVLCLFMLELGCVVGERLAEVRRFGGPLLVLGLGLPPLLALLGAGVGVALNLSAGGIALLATLAASASYIAAPAAIRLALPQANAALAITASLAVTFPFNVVLGIPVYARLGVWWG
ncbi:MAG: sodium-dependent bicarbonate transport family permease, partial [Ramlibacter sp.]